MDEVKRLEELMDVYGLKIRIIPLDEEGISEIEGETDQLFSRGFDRGRSLRRVRMFFEEQVLYVLKDGFGVAEHTFSGCPTWRGRRPASYISAPSSSIPRISCGRTLPETWYSQRASAAGWRTFFAVCL